MGLPESGNTSWEWVFAEIRREEIGGARGVESSLFCKFISTFIRSKVEMTGGPMNLKFD